MTTRRHQQNRIALGSQASLSVVLDNEVAANALYAKAWQHIDTFEQRFSRFISHSELSQVNANAGEWTTVSQDFLSMVQACQYWHGATGGIFNPFVLPTLQRHGYKSSWPHPHRCIDRSLDVSGRALIHFDMLEVNHNKIRVPANAALDFGGIGKGYMLDELAELFAAENIDNYCVSLGGDVLCQGHDYDADAWTIRVLNTTSTDAIESVTNQKGSKLAVASSGTVKRRGPDWHHIIDPSTGMPSSSNVLVATVLSDSGAAADVIAKTLVIDPIMADQADIQDSIKAYIFQTVTGEIIRSNSV
jgi:thiamine biosynthesis lipoprotein